MKELTITFGVKPDDSRITGFDANTGKFIKELDGILESTSETIDVVFGEEYSRTRYLATELADNESKLVTGILLALVEKSERPRSKAVVVGVNFAHDIAVFSYAPQADIKTSSHHWQEDFQHALQEALKNPGVYLSEEYYLSQGDVYHLPTIKGQLFSLIIE